MTVFGLIGFFKGNWKVVFIGIAALAAVSFFWSWLSYRDDAQRVEALEELKEITEQNVRIVDDGLKTDVEVRAVTSKAVRKIPRGTDNGKTALSPELGDAIRSFNNGMQRIQDRSH